MDFFILCRNIPNYRIPKYIFLLYYSKFQKHRYVCCFTIFLEYSVYIPYSKKRYFHDFIIFEIYLLSILLLWEVSWNIPKKIPWNIQYQEKNKVAFLGGRKI